MTRWVVIGGGAAGCVVAARLSAVAGNEVTLLEAGPDHPVAGVPGEPVLDRPARLMHDVLVVRRPGLAPQTYHQGFGLGGSSLVNGGVVVGDPRTEAIGHDLPVEAVAELGPVATTAIELTPDAQPVALVRRGGSRVSVADAYLRPFVGHERLDVRCDSAAVHVEFEGTELEGRRVRSVVTRSGDEFEADRVVVCAGAIATPALLLRSGVVTPGVGERLQDHVGVSFSFDLVAPTSSGVTIGATVERPGRQIVLMDRIPDRPDMGAAIAGVLTVASEGRVVLPHPDEPPVAELHQLDAPEDLAALAVVAREALELLDGLADRGVVGRRYVDRDGTSPDGLLDDDAMTAWLPAHLGGYHHVSGSCRIGGPLDVNGALVGYEGVYVADASALPGVPVRNPYLAVIRQAERLSAAWTSRA